MRFNINLGFPEPILYNFGAIDKLEEKTIYYLRNRSEIRKFYDRAIISMFYFELDSLPVRDTTSRRGL